MLKVVQTSLGSPSNQWGQVSCTYDNPIEAAKSVVGANSNKTSHDPRELFPDGQGKSGVYYPPSATIHVDFNSGPTFPEREPILGFGGAFTEAAALNYRSLNEEGREAVLGLLFGSEGLGYR
jgi:glucosylceramidase